MKGTWGRSEAQCLARALVSTRPLGDPTSRNVLILRGQSHQSGFGERWRGAAQLPSNRVTPDYFVFPSAPLRFHPAGSWCLPSRATCTRPMTLRSSPSLRISVCSRRISWFVVPGPFEFQFPPPSVPRYRADLNLTIHHLTVPPPPFSPRLPVIFSLSTCPNTIPGLA